MERRVTAEKVKRLGKDSAAARKIRGLEAKPDAAPAKRVSVATAAKKTVRAVEALPPAPVPEAPAAVAVQAATGTIIDHASLLFDPVWYSTTYPDVAAAGLDPVRHFFDNGAREGRDPNQHFNTTWYLSTNADVVASKMNPFLHYLFYGALEGRKPRP